MSAISEIAKRLVKPSEITGHLDSTTYRSVARVVQLIDEGRDPERYTLRISPVLNSVMQTRAQLEALALLGKVEKADTANIEPELLELTRAEAMADVNRVEVAFRLANRGADVEKR